MKNSGLHNVRGFTLVEMSIVLAIISLIAGAILIGRDMMTSASVRAQISQMEKYHAAVHTFRGKYNGMPGDLHREQALAFGLFAFDASLAGVPRFGDNNGIVQPCDVPPYQYECGETLAFWKHLSEAGLADGTFGTALNPATGTVDAGVTVAKLDTVMPRTKLKHNGYIGVTDYGAYVYAEDGRNYFYIASKWPPGIQPNGFAQWSAALSAAESYEMDKKMDDGLPQTGNVRAYGMPGCMDYDTGANAYIYTQGSETNVCISYFHFY